MKPYQTFAFLILVCLLYAVLSLLVPQGGIDVGYLKIRIPNPLASIKSNLTGTRLAQIDSLSSRYPKASGEKPSDSSGVSPKSTSRAMSKNDSVSIVAHARRNKKGELMNFVPIEFPSESNSLNSFFKAITMREQGDGCVRVLHFGDSQVEGDRITNQLRGMLQNKFGGSGIGLIPLWQADYLTAYYGVTLSNSVRVTSLVSAKPQYKPECALGSIAFIEPSESFKEVVTIRPTPRFRFENINLIFGTSDSTYSVRVLADTAVCFTERVDSVEGSIHLCKIRLPRQFQRISIQVSNGSEVKLYGIFADSDRGISVSNIALRGSSGNFFTQLDLHLASKIFSMLNVRLIVLQFGINVVPSNLSNYAYYERTLSEQIRAIRRYAPQVSILVVGVTDMATRQNGVLESYSAVKLVLDAQRRAALQNGAAFWDGYLAMGGEGSIIDWVNASPPLATKDYTHFTQYGANRFGQMLAKAIKQKIESLAEAIHDSSSLHPETYTNE